MTTLIFPKNQGQCASFSINVTILFLSFKRGTTVSNRAQQIDWQSQLPTAEKENTDRIPFILTLHLHNDAVKSIIFKNFKWLQNDSETGTIFSQPPPISLKRDKNIGNFLVRSSFQTNDQPGTFKCARSRCETCPVIHNVGKLLGPKRSNKDHWSLCVHLCQCHNLHLLPKALHWWNRKTTGWPISRTPSRRREKCQGRIQISR